MDEQIIQHQARLLKTRNKIPYFPVLVHSFLWFLFGPNRRKFSKVWVTYKFGGISLCWHRAIERFANEDIDFFQNFLILIRAIRCFFFGPQKRKFKKFLATYKHGDISLCWHRMKEEFGKTKESSYNPFQNQLSYTQSEYIITQCSIKPLISIIVPVYKIDPKWLKKCIKSVAAQHYDNWELILVDDASKRNNLKQLMNAWTILDKRIHAFYLDKNSGIACATNFGIRQTNGKLIGFLDHDDELTPDALTWITWAINKNPQAMWFYSDEDKISENEYYHSPYFKPDFSPEFLLSNMYTCHFSIYSAEILNKVGGLRDGFEGAQDHDLALRISEIVSKKNVVHIPRILYHWRETATSTATGAEAKPKAAVSGRKAVSEALKRRCLKGEISSHKIYPTIYHITLQPTSFPKVSIIIPTRNSLSLIKKCLSSLRKHTCYQNYEIVIIDNQSDKKSFLKYIHEKQSMRDIKVLRYDKPFNHSDMNNMAVESVDSELVVFMNNDIEIISDNWLEQLVATINIDKSIACVGCLLLYQDGTVQHGGIILGLGGVAGHAHKYLYKDSIGYFGRLQCLQEIFGVTAALSLVRKSAFKTAGGFNSDRYPLSFNDVDLAIRLRTKGHRCLYNPMVQAIHYESKTRPITSEELVYQQRIKKDYSEILSKDPFYNPNLSLDNEQFNGFRPFPIEKQISELRSLNIKVNTTKELCYKEPFSKHYPSIKS